MPVGIGWVLEVRWAKPVHVVIITFLKSYSKLDKPQNQPSSRSLFFIFSNCGQSTYFFLSFPRHFLFFPFNFFFCCCYYYYLDYFAFHQNLKPCLYPILAHILKWIQASNFPSFCLRRVWYLQSFLSHFVLGEPTATHTRRRKIRSALSPWEVPARAC